MAKTSDVFKAFICACLIAVAIPALVWAGMAAFKVCDSKTATQNTTTYCDLIDIGELQNVAMQYQCTSATGAPNVTLSWVGGAGPTITNATSAVNGYSAIKTNSTVETLSDIYMANSTSNYVGGVVAPKGTIKIVENNAQADTICNVWIYGRDK